VGLARARRHDGSARSGACTTLAWYTAINSSKFANAGPSWGWRAPFVVMAAEPETAVWYNAQNPSHLLPAGPSWGWRAPFVIVAVPTVALATLAWYTVGEPQRGITEAALQGEYENNDFEYEEKIDWEKTKMLMKIRTNLCVILQASALAVPCCRLQSLLSPHKGS